VSDPSRVLTVWEQALLIRSRGARTRREILFTLNSDALCYSDIAKELDLTVTTISRHCSILKKIQLLDNERIGNFIMCHLTERGEKIADLFKKNRLG
jgi:predicted transcriptional regulator